MTDESKEICTNEMKYGMDVELSERELLSIGKIVAWGFRTMVIRVPGGW